MSGEQSAASVVATGALADVLAKASMQRAGYDVCEKLLVQSQRLDCGFVDGARDDQAIIPLEISKSRSCFHA
jgi:hypothetical protein